MGWLTRNWHLKLAALGLATILYTGFVYSGSFTDQLFPGLQIEAINQPNGAYPLTQQFGTVDVQYRLSADARKRGDHQHHDDTGRRHGSGHGDRQQALHRPPERSRLRRPDIERTMKAA